MYAFEPSGKKASLAGPERTKTVSSIASVFVLMIATEFWDGIVAYISACVGTRDECRGRKGILRNDIAKSRAGVRHAD